MNDAASPTEPTPTGRYRAVVFDLGQVLVRYDWKRATAIWQRIPAKDFAEIKALFLGRTDFFGLETGAVTPRAYHGQVAALMNEPITYEVFCEAFNAIFTGEITPVADAARRLHAGGHIKVGVLSNTNAVHAAFLRGTHGTILNELTQEHVFLSHEIGHRKPNADAYRHVLARMDVPAAETVFVDDLPENIHAAETLGMHGILAESPEQILADLARAGVLDSEGA